MEAIQFLALVRSPPNEVTADDEGNLQVSQTASPPFDVDFYSKMEADPHMRFVDHMGMEPAAMYWTRKENHFVDITEPVGDQSARITMEMSHADGAE